LAFERYLITNHTGYANKIQWTGQFEALLIMELKTY